MADYICLSFVTTEPAPLCKLKNKRLKRSLFQVVKGWQKKGF